MNVDSSPVRRTEVRPLVSVTLREIARRRAVGSLTQEAFAVQVERLAADELRPQGQHLLVREIRDGHTRFLIKDHTGAVCEMVGCEGATPVHDGAA